MKYGHYESNFLIVYPIGQNYEIVEMYNIRKYYKTYIKHYGNWSNETGLMATDEYIFSRRFNLDKSPLMLHTFGFQVHVGIKKIYCLISSFSHYQRLALTSPLVSNPEDSGLLDGHTRPICSTDMRIWHLDVRFTSKT